VPFISLHNEPINGDILFHDALSFINRLLETSQDHDIIKRANNIIARMGKGEEDVEQIEKEKDEERGGSLQL
jgi:hypothetical protein